MSHIFKQPDITPSKDVKSNYSLGVSGHLHLQDDVICALTNGRKLRECFTTEG